MTALNHGSRTQPALFSDLSAAPGAPRKEGLFPSQAIRELIEAHRIDASSPIDEAQVQPASLDLRLGDLAHRVRASFVPGSTAVSVKLATMEMGRQDLTGGAVLERGCVYVIPLQERLRLPREVWARANPRSTAGRLDVFTRVIVDYGSEFEKVSAGYVGPLYAEVAPRAFSIRVAAGMTLTQLRFGRGREGMGDGVLADLARHEPIVYSPTGNPESPDIAGGVGVTVDLGSSGQEIVGYRAKPEVPVIDLAKIHYYHVDEFWDPLIRPASRQLILQPGGFYILGSRERVSVPPDYAADMVPYRTAAGEFRVHYAGFFDPGFGYNRPDANGTKAVLEVRAHEVPFLIEEGQVAGRLRYLRMLGRPDKLYGAAIGSSYQKQELSLSKQFIQMSPTGATT